MGNVLLFIGGAIAGAYGMYNHIYHKLAGNKTLDELIGFKVFKNDTKK